MLISLAWKNIWRNKSRSLILVTAIALGLTSAIFIIAMSDGMIKDRNKTVINNETSHIQIHNKKFKDNMKIVYFIPSADKITATLDTMKEVKSYCTRVKTGAMASTSRGNSGVIVMGIDPQREKQVTQIYKNLVDSNSTYFGGRGKNQILIGDDLAKQLQLTTYQLNDKNLEELAQKIDDQDVISKLDSLKDKRFRSAVKFYDALEDLLTQKQYEQYADMIADNCVKYKLGRKIILRMQALNGEITEEAFRVTGVFSTTNQMFDQTTVFVEKDYLDQILGLKKDQIHEIAIMLNDEKQLESTKEKLAKKFPNVLVEDMYSLDPYMKMAKSMAVIYYFIFELFILFALSFGIVNSMLMAVLERTKEIGMLMAIGMKKAKVFTMIILETVMLSLTGGIAGMILGYLIVTYTGHTGLDFSAYMKQGSESLGVSPVVYPQLPFYIIVGTTILVILTAIVAAIYPAVKAIKLKPVDALRSDV